MSIQPAPHRSLFAVWRWRKRVWVVIAVVWLVAYPLSIGPVLWLQEQGYLPIWAQQALALVYLPLMLAAEALSSIQSVEDALSWYIELWR